MGFDGRRLGGHQRVEVGQGRPIGRRGGEQFVDLRLRYVQAPEAIAGVGVGGAPALNGDPDATLKQGKPRQEVVERRVPLSDVGPDQHGLGLIRDLPRPLLRQAALPARSWPPARNLANPDAPARLAGRRSVERFIGKGGAGRAHVTA